MVLVTGGTSQSHPTVARRNIEILSRNVRPRVLHAGRKRHRATPDERCAVDVHIILRQLRPDAGVEHGVARRRLRPRSAWHGSGTCEQRNELSTIDHVPPWWSPRFATSPAYGQAICFDF